MSNVKKEQEVMSNAKKEQETMSNAKKEQEVDISIKEAKKILYLTPLHIRSLCRQGKIDAYQDESNRWHLKRSSVNEYASKRDEKKQNHDKRIENDSKQPNIRPTTQACRRIRQKVENDDKLTQEQQKLFLSRLKQYEIDYDKLYLERYTKK